MTYQPGIIAAIFAILGVINWGINGLLIGIFIGAVLEIILRRIGF